MSRMKSIGKGRELEARIQRLFMCQGAFAERGLFVRTRRASSRLVTDIDVIAHDYNINFHHRKIYAECKGGKNVSTLDRVVWVRGVMNVVGAEFGYLVVDVCDADSAAFARAHGVEVLQGAGLLALEEALGIGDSFWPGRTNLIFHDAVEKGIEKALTSTDKGEFITWLRAAADVWREASALALSYGRLNALLGLLGTSRGFSGKMALRAEERILMGYAVGALLVRLSQYILFAASDTLSMTRTEREEYLRERLTAGTIDIGQARLLLDSALHLAKSTLEEQGITPPPNWEADHLLRSPAYAVPFAQVVERVIGDGHRARILPLSMELRLFGYAGAARDSAGLLRRFEYAVPLTGLIRALAVQSLGVPEEFTNGVASLSREVTDTQGGASKSSPAVLFGPAPPDEQDVGPKPSPGSASPSSA